MSARLERIAAQKERHLEALEGMGLTGAFRTLRAIENQAHYEAELYCNGDIDSDESDRRDAIIAERVKRAFGGKLPEGFVLNGDPRGYALKIDFVSNEKVAIPDGMVRDWGGYGIIAPEFN